MKIQDIFQKYRNQLDHLDLELLVAHSIGKSREFIITHQELELSETQSSRINKLAKRRLNFEPMAYILGQKEFYGLNFKVNKHTLIPRPETELIVEKVLALNPKNSNIIDIGTGSGNIIISLAKNLEVKNNFYGIDISQKALQVAKENAKSNGVQKKIKFIRGNLLKTFTKKEIENSIIIANLPYLSKKIYDATMPDVKKFEPKSALVSAQDGLAHYKKLFSQIKFPATIFIEFSPEQKKNLEKIAKKLFPKAKITFYKDLSQKWRILKIENI